MSDEIPEHQRHYDRGVEDTTHQLTAKMPQTMVRVFHEKFRHPFNDKLTSLSINLRDLRLNLILEEFLELVAASGFEATLAGTEFALAHVEGSIQDPVEMADALGDLIYVVYGMAHCMGINLDWVVQEIHESNMSKLGLDGEPIINHCLREGDPTHDCEAIDQLCEPQDPTKPIGKILKGPNYLEPNIAPLIGL